MVGYTHNKPNVQKRLSRIEGQIRGLQAMVEADRYCIDVLDQIAAASKALDGVAVLLLEEHLGHCVAEAIASGGSEADQKLKEATAAVARLVKS